MTAITVSDIMPALDGVIAQRIETDIAAAIASEYGTAAWNGSSSAKRFPFAASFTDTSYTLKGVVGNRGGLLPVTYSQQPGSTTDCVSASDSRCDPTFVAWKTSGTLTYTAPPAHHNIWNHQHHQHSGLQPVHNRNHCCELDRPWRNYERNAHQPELQRKHLNDAPVHRWIRPHVHQLQSPGLYFDVHLAH